MIEDRVREDIAFIRHAVEEGRLPPRAQAIAVTAQG